MEQEEALPFLRSLLYTYLFRCHVSATPAYVEQLRLTYGPEEFKRVERSLEWAASNTAFSFSSLPEVTDATDEEIREHFSRLLSLTKLGNMSEPGAPANGGCDVGSS